MTAASNAPIKQIVGLFPELLGVGGVQEAGRLTAAAITASAARNGWSVELCTLNDPYGPHSLGVGGHAISFFGFGREKIRFALSGLSRSLFADKGNVVIAGHPNLAVPASWMHRTHRLIVMCHGIEVWNPLPRLRRRSLVASDVALAPSTDTAQRLVEVQGVAASRVHKLAWPMSPAFLRLAEASPNLPRPEAFPSGPVILTVGRWVSTERYKGADELIRTVAQLQREISDLNLVAVGSGDDLPRLRKLAVESGVADRVRFLENISREELAACYAHTDIFALPSAGEGFGLVFLEAMAFSKPVIGAACGGTTDVVENELNGLLVPPHDSEQLTDAIRRLVRDLPLRERLGKTGAQIVREKYRFEVFRSELESIVNGLPFSPFTKVPNCDPADPA